MLFVAVIIINILIACDHKSSAPSNVLQERESKATPLAATPLPKQITLQMYKFNGTSTDSYNQRVAEHQSFLSGFVALLKEQCRINHEFNIPAPKEIASTPGSSSFAQPGRLTPPPGLTSQVSDFPFQFYQYELYQLLQQNLSQEAIRSPKEISIMLMEGLEDNCGFALPEVQFEEVPKTKKNLAVINLLKNRVLINTNPRRRECTNPQRILYHELAHILVQDNPAHTCRTADGGNQLCTKENLLASLVWIPSRARSDDRGFGRDSDPGDNLIQVTANGTKLNSYQCASIEKTLSHLANQ